MSQNRPIRTGMKTDFKQLEAIFGATQVTTPELTEELRRSEEALADEKDKTEINRLESNIHFLRATLKKRAANKHAEVTLGAEPEASKHELPLRPPPPPPRPLSPRPQPTPPPPPPPAPNQLHVPQCPAQQEHPAQPLTRQVALRKVLLDVELVVGPVLLRKEEHREVVAAAVSAAHTAMRKYAMAKPGYDFLNPPIGDDVLLPTQIATIAIQGAVKHLAQVYEGVECDASWARLALAKFTPSNDDDYDLVTETPQGKQYSCLQLIRHRLHRVFCCCYRYEQPEPFRSSNYERLRDAALGQHVHAPVLLDFPQPHQGRCPQRSGWVSLLKWLLIVMSVLTFILVLSIPAILLAGRGWSHLASLDQHHKSPQDLMSRRHCAFDFSANGYLYRPGLCTLCDSTYARFYKPASCAQCLVSNGYSDIQALKERQCNEPVER